MTEPTHETDLDVEGAMQELEVLLPFGYPSLIYSAEHRRQRVMSVLAHFGYTKFKEGQADGIAAVLADPQNYDLVPNRP